MIPNEIKDAVSALGHELRWCIVERLQQSDLSYTELLRSIKVSKGRLTHHLNRLMESGLVDNFSQGYVKEPYSSYYRLSDFGKDFISALLISVEVVPIRSLRSEENSTVLKSLYNLKTCEETRSNMRVFETMERSTFRNNKSFLPKNENRAKMKHWLFSKWIR